MGKDLVDYLVARFRAVKRITRRWFMVAIQTLPHKHNEGQVPAAGAC